MASVAISVANTLIIDASMRTSRPWSCLTAASITIRRQACSFGRGIGDPPLDGLPVGQLLAEGHALVGVLDQHVEGALRHAYAPGAHLQAPHGEPKLHRREALPDAAQHLPLVDPAVLENDLVGPKNRPASEWRGPRPAP